MTKVGQSYLAIDLTPFSSTITGCCIATIVVEVIDPTAVAVVIGHNVVAGPTAVVDQGIAFA